MSNYSEQFLKQTPLAVLGVLRDLQKGQVPLRISWASGQFISKILDVSPEGLIMDFGSQEYDNKAVQVFPHLRTALSGLLLQSQDAG
ncbi:MAG: flagellar brake protein [Enterobacter kobei]|nr:flagellar brake protein [Enterobacter kobei]